MSSRKVRGELGSKDSVYGTESNTKLIRHGVRHLKFILHVRLVLWEYLVGL